MRRNREVLEGKDGSELRANRQRHVSRRAPLVDQFLHLQATVGNRAVLRLLNRPTPSIQARLTVGPVADPFEREAERIAREVSGASAPASHAVEGTSQGPVLPAGGAVESDVESKIARARSGGRPLGAKVRGPMEAAFGQDFSRVRVHADESASQLSRSLSADAFTTGSDIFFRQGAYSPSSSRGRHVLAHELAHVVQQGSRVRRSAAESTVVRRLYTDQTTEAHIRQAAIPPKQQKLATIHAAIVQNLDNYHVQTVAPLAHDPAAVGQVAKSMASKLNEVTKQCLAYKREAKKTDPLLLKVDEFLGSLHNELEAVKMISVRLDEFTGQPDWDSALVVAAGRVGIREEARETFMPGGEAKTIADLQQAGKWGIGFARGGGENVKAITRASAALSPPWANPIIAVATAQALPPTGFGSRFGPSDKIDLDIPAHRQWMARRIQATLDALYSSTPPKELLLMASDIAVQIERAGGSVQEQIVQAAGLLILRGLAPPMAMSPDPARKISIAVQILGTNAPVSAKQGWMGQPGDPIRDTVENNRDPLAKWFEFVVIRSGKAEKKTATSQGPPSPSNRRRVVKL